MNKKRKPNLLVFIFLVLISLIPLLDFFKPGLPLTHDGQDHAARIANFYQSLSEGNLIPRWAGNLNWGYGHPILMFLYPLPSYVASFFLFLGLPLINSVKLVFGLSFFLSGWFMYLWLKEIWGKEAGLVGGLIYLLAPYRFVDLYVRGAIGECWAFVWPPLIAWFLVKLFRKVEWRYFAGASLSLAAFILSHNALSLMFLPFILGYMAYLIFQSKKRLKLSLSFLLIIGFGFSLASFFWLPAFFEGRYTLRDIVTKGNIAGFEPFSRILWSDWSYGGTGALSVQLGLLQWLGVLLGAVVIWRLFKKKDQTYLFLLFLWLLFWVSILMFLPFMKPLYLKISLLQKFQFAWRWLSLAVFPPAVFLAAFVYLLPQKKKTLLLLFLFLVAFLLNRNYWQAKDFLFREEAFFKEPYPGTTDTGESAPIWSIRFMEEFPEAPMAVIDGQAEIEAIERQSNRHEFTLQTSTQTRLVENTLYFPGWQVLVDGKPTVIQFQDPDYRGLMTFYVPPGKHQVVVQFGETKLRFWANLISLASLIALALSLAVIKWLRKR